MTRNILLCFCLLISAFAVNAQWTYTTSPTLPLNSVSDTDDHEYTINISNGSSEEYQVFWTVEKCDNVPAEWQTQVCDLNLCYLFNVNQNPSSKPNIMTPGAHIFTFHISANGVAGASKMNLILYTDAARTQKILTIPIISGDCTTSSKNYSELTGLKLYPNPATDYFQVSNSSNVKKVVVYNILGREVKTFYNISGASFDISSFRKGMYVVRLFDNNNKLIKTLRLSKTSEGA